MENFAISSDLIRGHIDTIILKSLFDGDKFAQEISNYIEQKSNNNYEVKQATLYSALKRLENAKYVKSYWQDVDCGGRRKIFNLTEKGKNYAESQLINWDFSRNVINNLVDEKDTDFLKVKAQDKSITNPVPIFIVKDKPEDSLSKIKDFNQKSIDVSKESIQEKQEKEQEKSLFSSEFKNISENNTTQNKNINQFNDLNYKQILGNLMENAISKNSKESEINNKNISESEEIDKKTDLNDNIFINHTPSTISLSEINNELNIPKKKVGKIDFSDLLEDAEKEGYKIRISSNSNKSQKGQILINKVNLLSSLSMFIIALLEIFLINYTAKTTINGVYYYIAILFFALFPIVSIIKFTKNPGKTILSYNYSSLVTCLIVVFNLLLVLAAYNIIKSTDLTDYSELLTKVIAPILLLVNIFLWFCLRNLFVKNNKCLSK